LLGIIYVLNQGAPSAGHLPLRSELLRGGPVFCLFIRGSQKFRTVSSISACSGTGTSHLPTVRTLLVMQAFSGALFYAAVLLEYVRGFSTETSGLILAILPSQSLLPDPVRNPLRPDRGKNPVRGFLRYPDVGFILITLRKARAVNSYSIPGSSHRPRGRRVHPVEQCPLS
jgi:hypothetical protein